MIYRVNSKFLWIRTWTWPFCLCKTCRVYVGFNPCYLDDNVYANEVYFKTLVRRASFDSEVDTLELPDDYPFLDPASLQPGCLIVKIGATTGNTIGQFLCIASVQYSAKLHGSNDREPSEVRNAILVQWEPGQRFTA